MHKILNGKTLNPKFTEQFVVNMNIRQPLMSNAFKFVMRGLA